MKKPISILNTSIFAFILLYITFTGCFENTSEDSPQPPPILPSYVVSGTVSLPGTDSLTGGSLEILFYNGSYCLTYYDYWSSGNTQTYTAYLNDGTYETVFIYIYDEHNQLVYQYATNSSGLIIDGSDISGIDFIAVAAVDYTVTGNIILPDADTLTNGSYTISFSGYKHKSVSGTWASGHTQPYSIELPPGYYNTIYIQVNTASSDVRYECTIENAALLITDAGISEFDLNINTHTVSGTISLAGSHTATGAYYKIQFSDRSSGKYREIQGDWPSGNSQSYSIELEPGNYDTIIIEIFDEGSDELLYQYSPASGITVTDSDISGYDLTILNYIASGTISLPDADTLSGGSYIISFWCTSAYRTISGSWGSGHSHSYSVALSPGNYNVTIDVYDSADNRLYGYNSSTPVLTVSDSDTSGHDFTVVNYTFSGTISLPGTDSITGGIYEITFDDYYNVRTLSGPWDSGHSLSYSVDLAPGYYYITVKVYDTSYNLLYFSDDLPEFRVSNSDISGYNILLEKYVRYTVSGTMSLLGVEPLTDGYYYVYFSKESSSSYVYTSGSWVSGNTQTYSILLEPGIYDSIRVRVYDNSSSLLYEYDDWSPDLTVEDSDITNIDIIVVPYTVTGTIYLPGTETLTNHHYSISFGGTNHGSTQGTWVSGNSQTYSVGLEPGTYDYVHISISDPYDYIDPFNEIYSYTTFSYDLEVTDSNISGLDFYVE